MEDIQRSSCDDTEDQMQHFFSRKSSAVSGREKNPPDLGQFAPMDCTDRYAFIVSISVTLTITVCSDPQRGLH